MTAAHSLLFAIRVKPLVEAHGRETCIVNPAQRNSHFYKGLFNGARKVKLARRRFFNAIKL